MTYDVQERPLSPHAWIEKRRIGEDNGRVKSEQREKSTCGVGKA